MSNSSPYFISSPRIPGEWEADSSSSSRSSWWPLSTTGTRAPAATTSASGWSGSGTGGTGDSTAGTMTFRPTGATTPAWCRGAFVVSILEIKLLASIRESEYTIICNLRLRMLLLFLLEWLPSISRLPVQDDESFERKLNPCQFLTEKKSFCETLEL